MSDSERIELALQTLHVEIQYLLNSKDDSTKKLGSLIGELKDLIEILEK